MTKFLKPTSVEKKKKSSLRFGVLELRSRTGKFVGKPCVEAAVRMHVFKTYPGVKLSDREGSAQDRYRGLDPEGEGGHETDLRVEDFAGCLNVRVFGHRPILGRG